jgi:hypothetical protein
VQPIPEYIVSMCILCTWAFIVHIVMPDSFDKVVNTSVYSLGYCGYYGC